jgi:hypothetical protein
LISVWYYVNDTGAHLEQKLINVVRNMMAPVALFRVASGFRTFLAGRLSIKGIKVDAPGDERAAQ